MGRIVYVNGAYVPEAEARVSIFDRAFLFADAVYEVVAVLDGALLDFDAHMSRLGRSLEALGIAMPMDASGLRDIHAELLKRNALDEGLVYLQVSRGVADRDFAVTPDLTPGLVLFTQAVRLVKETVPVWRVVTMPDQRWARRDIKTVQLLAPSMAKMAAKRAGYDDAWMVEDAMVTEGTSNNAYIVRGGAILTRPLSNAILHGITRAAVLRLARETGVAVEERAFSVQEARSADEAFVTSAGAFVTGVVEIDGHRIGDGAAGPLTRRLREIYIAEARARAARTPG